MNRLRPLKGSEENEMRSTAYGEVHECKLEAGHQWRAFNYTSLVGQGVYATELATEFDCGNQLIDVSVFVMIFDFAFLQVF